MSELCQFEEVLWALGANLCRISPFSPGLSSGNTGRILGTVTDQSGGYVLTPPSP